MAVDLAIGHIAGLRIERDGRVLEPLHRAPWAGRPQEWPKDIAPGLAGLSGDFFCAPFSANDIEPAPTHGWSANSSWSAIEEMPLGAGLMARFRLDRPILGASVEKVLTLRDGHPFLYQEHRIIGGHGRLPVAHHAMTRMEDGGTLAFSAKRCAVTPLAAREAGSVLAYPHLSQFPHALPLASGGTVDLGRYPLADRHEDFVVLVEDRHEAIGWTAVTRHAERDVLLVLKDPRCLPVTMLWYSHGGRDHAPWNGRHRGVLGIEDGRTAVGHRQSVNDNELSAMGVATAFDLDPGKTIVVRQVIGALPADGMVRRVTVGTGRLLIGMEDGDDMSVPFDDQFLKMTDGE